MRDVEREGRGRKRRGNRSLSVSDVEREGRAKLSH